MSEPMKHLDNETLSRLREGHLDKVRAADARAHLEACDDCRARVEALDRMIARLTEPPEEEIPPLLAGRLAEEYGAPKAEARRAAWVRFAPALVGVAAAVAVATIAVRTYAPGQLGGPAGAPPTAEKAAAPGGAESSGAATADSAAGRGGESTSTHSLQGPGATDGPRFQTFPDRWGATAPTGTAGRRALSAAAPTSALSAYAGPALPIPMLDTPSEGVDMAYVRAIVSQPGILAYARRHAQGIAEAWDERYGGFVRRRAPRLPPGPGVHETLGIAAVNDRLLILTAVARGISGVQAREAIDAARKAWPGMRSGPAGWVSEAPIVWMARGNWEPTGEQVWVVVGIDVFSPIEGAFKVQAVVLDSNGNVLARAGSGAEKAAPLR